MLHLPVPPQLEGPLAELSPESREGLEKHLREAIEEYLWEQKHGEIALQRLADLDGGRTHAVPLEQVIADLDLED